MYNKEQEREQGLLDRKSVYRVCFRVEETELVGKAGIHVQNNKGAAIERENIKMLAMH